MLDRISNIEDTAPSPYKGEGWDGGVHNTRLTLLSCRWKGSLLCSLFIALSMVAAAGSADVPKPKIPKGKGDRCVEDTNVMRKNHMEFLLHQRDETVHDGIRTKKHSLKECLSCHAVNDEKNMPVGIDDKRHFCNSCHTYAAVSIDCFECHQSKPDAPKVSGLPP